MEPEVHALRKDLPGHVRQRVKRAIDGLVENPRPPGSRILDVSGLAMPRDVEVLRLRIERWRVVYAVNEKEGWVWVLALRRRPPYDYGDLEKLAGKLE